MNTPFDFKALQKDRLVYIRPIDVAELPDEIRAQAPGHDKVYGVHSPEGLCLALVRDRKAAFALARENDFAPVAVH